MMTTDRLVTENVRVRHVSRSRARGDWDEPAALAWLSAGEQETWATLRAPQRREAWLYARLLAKQLLLDRMAEELPGDDLPAPSQIEIYSRDGLGRAVRPWVVVDGRAQPWRLSIAHSSESILVALSDSDAFGIGVDLARIDAVSDAVVALWFAPEEQRWLAAGGPDDRPRRASTVWALKEAVYKATNRGEQFRPRQIEIRCGESGEVGFRLEGAAREYRCRTQIDQSDGELAVLVTVGERRPISV